MFFVSPFENVIVPPPMPTAEPALWPAAGSPVPNPRVHPLKVLEARVVQLTSSPAMFTIQGGPEFQFATLATVKLASLDAMVDDSVVFCTTKSVAALASVRVVVFGQ